MQAKIKGKIRQNQAFDQEIIFIGILFELYWIRGIYKQFIPKDQFQDFPPTRV